jgi:hypothetical protein
MAYVLWARSSHSAVGLAPWGVSPYLERTHAFLTGTGTQC